MLLDRLLQSGASLEATNAAAMTPLGVLLQTCSHFSLIRQGTVDTVRALLDAGCTLQAAGGGRAWQRVLKSAFLAPLSSSGSRGGWLPITQWVPRGDHQFTASVPLVSPTAAHTHC